MKRTALSFFISFLLENFVYQPRFLKHSLRNSYEELNTVMRNSLTESLHRVRFAKFDLQNVLGNIPMKHFLPSVGYMDILNRKFMTSLLLIKLNLIGTIISSKNRIIKSVIHITSALI
jgi:hypothetical protein